MKKEFNNYIIESDLYLTKDGYLVYNHDSYIDETCNSIHEALFWAVWF